MLLFVLKQAVRGPVIFLIVWYICIYVMCVKHKCRSSHRWCCYYFHTAAQQKFKQYLCKDSKVETCKMANTDVNNFIFQNYLCKCFHEERYAYNTYRYMWCVLLRCPYFDFDTHNAYCTKEQFKISAVGQVWRVMMFTKKCSDNDFIIFHLIQISLAGLGVDSKTYGFVTVCVGPIIRDNTTISSTVTVLPTF